ncbi:hypothetical protein BDV93DRAFT_525200 [Ceratobasidium sp. AG-I]|nr:hypothetical protein BDV93DRAFT_525200 [Ceratobasidium sp. AG-I]
MIPFCLVYLACWYGNEPGTSFVDRRLNLVGGIVAVYLARHCAYGSNHLRLVFTWGFWNTKIPGYIIPTIYLTSTVRVSRRCSGLNLKIFTNVRQDVVSVSLVSN